MEAPFFASKKTSVPKIVSPHKNLGASVRLQAAGSGYPLQSFLLFQKRDAFLEKQKRISASIPGALKRCRTAGAGSKSFVFFLILFLVPAFLYSQWSWKAQRRDPLEEYRNGNFEEAVKICKAEITADPGNLESHVVICRSLVKLGRYEEGRTYALAGRNISRYDPRIVEILGEVYFFQGRNNEAMRYFEEYISLAPQGDRISSVYYYIGEILIRQGQFRRADIALSTAVYYMPRNAHWWARLAYARENAGEFQTAAAAYEQAFALNENLPAARKGLERVKARLANF
jgi:tetratricopeptide (TPR) repeat protein